MAATPTTFSGLVGAFLDLINLAIPLIFSVVFLYLAWKIFSAWVINGADEKSREEGKQTALTAVIVFVVMITVWGIVSMLRNFLFGL